MVHCSSCPGVEAGGAAAGGDEEAPPADQGHGGSGQGHPGHVARRVGDDMETTDGIVGETKTNGRFVTKYGENWKTLRIYITMAILSVTSLVDSWVTCCNPPVFPCVPSVCDI